jgi:hypothetical protein
VKKIGNYNVVFVPRCPDIPSRIRNDDIQSPVFTNPARRFLEERQQLDYFGDQLNTISHEVGMIGCRSECSASPEAKVEGSSGVGMQKQRYVPLPSIGIIGGRAPHYKFVVDSELVIPMSVANDGHGGHHAFNMRSYSGSRR